MDVLHETISFETNSSLRIRNVKIQHFTFPLHQHTELEIVYVLKSFGERYIGDSIHSFKKGDLVLVGSRLPHSWKNDEIFYNNPKYTVEAIVIQFPANIIDSFTAFPEMAHLSKLLESASRGISFGKQTVLANHELLVSLPHYSGFDRMMHLMRLLNNLSTSTDFEFLASITYQNLENSTYARMSSTLDFISNNFKEQLSLEDIASNLNMSKSAFCNYFKRKTGKTAISYLNELRITYACKQLIQTDNHILEIAYDSGFGNISTFNKTFKSVIGKTPREYRILWSKSI